MSHCILCNRDLASEPETGKEPICTICGEEILRITHALVGRGSITILKFIETALYAKGYVAPFLGISDARLTSALTDYAEGLRGHTIPCDKCNPRRWSKDIL